MRINSQIANNLAQSGKSLATPDKSQDFGQLLMDALKDVNESQQNAMQLQNDLMANRPVEYHDLMIAMERASTAMSLTIQVRNKLLEAYQEISRMQV
ncbi:MAG: flagellar hook-basal body complex protein FliE [Fimbriimonadaceae bacterium]|nr:flagellar hook-basal body complex protein FliE [Fimbriimonadaceae bacterium]QYK54707.1 MAG: flagellar hook-basal body complex protein FliE [Fimbriimonadaceae bacterium]